MKASQVSLELCWVAVAENKFSWKCLKYEEKYRFIIIIIIIIIII